MSYVIDIVDAVVDLINAGSFTPSITAEKSVMPTISHENLGSDIKVLVSPAQVLSEPSSRSATQHDHQTVVRVIRRVTSPDDALVEQLFDLVEAVQSHIQFAELTGLSNVRYLGSEFDPIAAYEKLEDDGVFQSNLLITHRVVR